MRRVRLSIFSVWSCHYSEFHWQQSNTTTRNCAKYVLKSRARSLITRQIVFMHLTQNSNVQLTMMKVAANGTMLSLTNSIADYAVNQLRNGLPKIKRVLLLCTAISFGLLGWRSRAKAKGTFIFGVSDSHPGRNETQTSGANPIKGGSDLYFSASNKDFKMAILFVKNTVGTI